MAAAWMVHRFFVYTGFLKGDYILQNKRTLFCSSFYAAWECYKM
jgi:hypothetical protein